MKFNKETDYAIRMTLFCAEQKPKLLSGVEIVTECKVPENLGKSILSKLTSYNILESIKGKNGGFRYPHSNKTLSLYSIIEKFENLDINACVVNNKSCSYRLGKCVVCKKMTNLKIIFEKELKNIYMEDLIEEQKKIYNENF